MLDQDTSSDEPTTTSPTTDSPTTGETPETGGATGTGAEVAAEAEAARPVKKAAKRTAKKAASGTATKKTAAKRAAKKTTAPAEPPAASDTPADATAADAAAPDDIAAEDTAPAPKATRKAAAKATTAKKSATKKSTAKKTAKKPATPEPADAEPTVTAETPATPEPAATETDSAPADAPGAPVPLFQAPAPARRKRATKKTAAAEPAAETTATTDTTTDSRTDSGTDSTTAAREGEGADDVAAKPARGSRSRKKAASLAPGGDEPADAEAAAAADAVEAEDQDDQDEQDDEGGSGSGNARRRRRRGGRRRRRSGGGGDAADQDDESDDDTGSADDESSADTEGDDAAGSQGTSGSSRRRRRRRRSGDDADTSADDPEQTTTRVRRTRSPEDEITALSGSTRLEAKKQRRREGREAGRRRAPIVSEAEFLARREAVDRVMVIRQHKDLTQIAVMEDKVLVEHYVARESQTSLIGNVYLGRVQNVLPSMEAAFVDIGKGRNAVLYAGEVNWDALGAGNGPRKIEQVLKSGQPVLVQISKDPVGHKGARLTSQISLPGRFLVYVPDGTTSGISRKLPDTERNRLKTLLKEIVPDTAGVIVRTAAEGASEEELTRDVERLTARWEDIAAKAEKGNAPQLLYGEPDLTLKVVRDLFTEDFRRLVVSGDDAWDMVESYVGHLAPDLAERLERWTGDRDGDDVFAAYRIDEQIAKALDRKVWLPSGGSLIIDRTEAMTVVDVNTGKFTGSGGNLEETVTKNNLEAAEEIVRQLRLRDIGGIIVVDFIDMVLESNRDLVLRRLVECLGRDRTRHQVAEVTSLGLVQMTRKRIGTGLLEAFSENCEHCGGRGLVVHHEPVEQKRARPEEEPRRGRRSRGGRGRDESPDSSAPSSVSGSSTGAVPSPKEIAAMAKAAPRPAGATEGQAPDDTSADRPVEVSAEQAERQPAAPEEQPVAEQQPDQSDQSERAADTPDEPVVRTSRRGRRGSSRRAAGPPSAEPSVPAVVVPSTSSEPAAAEPAAAEPAAAEPAAEEPAAEFQQPEEAPAVEASPPTPAPDDQPTEPPATPRVVTSSRRRVVRRPAGPPAAVTAPAVDGAGSGALSEFDSSGTGEESGPGAEDGSALETAGAAAHVPVKRKGGGRKR